jgi:hypothetical protein
MKGLTMGAARAATAATAAVLLLAACGDGADRPAQAAGTDDAELAAANPQDAWWESVQALCGQAFAGEMTRYDAAMDTAWLNRDVIMHVRECTPGEIRIPLHVGEDRSRTWVLTRTADGIRLKHDHRHADGTEDETTQYGGDTVAQGTANRQEFPADEYSRELFLAQGHTAGVDNVWIMEVHPGERFVYNLTRPNRDFRADFDLTRPVAAPPPPWGSER